MQADLFYKTQCETAVPLYFVSEQQWKEGIDVSCASDRQCFITQEFKGKIGNFCHLNQPNGQVSKAYIGSGDGNQDLALANAALQLPACNYEVQGLLNQGAAITWALAQYRFDAYKKTEAKPRCLVISEEALKHILPMAEAIFLVRDLVNTPTNDMGPKEIAGVVEQLAKAHGGQWKQCTGDSLLKEGYPAIHAVGRASALAPRLVTLTWGDERHPLVTLVGKGVCFDSGGLDIKPAAGMRLMKKDMGGAAHVIGLAKWIMARRLPIRLHLFIPAVENAIGPNAFRPGDVLSMRNGLTVEIDNTDAEGRLILADALVKACEEQPDLIIDFATLTGAARVAVGTEIAALFTNNDYLATALNNASQKTGDPIWRLPLFPAYADMLKSNIADLSNSSASPYAGASVAALFLQRFITPTIPWAHFDVMSWNINSKPGKPEGGEAMGLRTCAEYLSKVYDTHS